MLIPGTMQSIKPHLRNKKHVIWDWNGTLLDDVDMVVSAIGKVLQAHNLPVTTRENYAEVFCFPVSEYYRRLGFDFEKTPFETVSNTFVDEYMQNILNCRLHHGVVELLSELSSAGITQSVLSAAHEESLHRHLAHFEICHFFERVYALSDHHAVGKSERGRELIADSGHSLTDTVLIGDTDHDLEVGKALGIDVILLGDGHQSYERLSRIHHTVIRDRHR